MKFLAISVLCLGCAWAQTAAPPAPVPSVTLPDLSDKTPVAALDDGTVLTMGEVRGLLSNLDPQQQQQAALKLREFLDQWALFQNIARMALADKLDQDTPTKEQLLWARNVVLYQAEVRRQANPA